jgi:hypothetical protein
MAYHNVLSVAADSLSEALERAAAIYITEHPGKPLRTYRTPPPAPVTPAVWIGLPILTVLSPLVAQTWMVTMAVDGDQPEQADTLYEIIGRVWDEVARQPGFKPDGVRPENIAIQGTDGTTALAAVMSVEHSTGARTLCPPNFADSTA